MLTINCSNKSFFISSIPITWPSLFTPNKTTPPSVFAKETSTSAISFVAFSESRPNLISWPLNTTSLNSR